MSREAVTVESLLEAFARGVVSGILATSNPGEASSSLRVPAKGRRRRGVLAASPASSPPIAARPIEVVPGNLPTPSFDQTDEQQPLPGMEDIPATTLAEMNAAMEKIIRGNGVPPGMFDPDDPESSRHRVPLS